jgi:hypothetical protein
MYSYFCDRNVWSEQSKNKQMTNKVVTDQIESLQSFKVLQIFIVTAKTISEMQID